MAAPSEYGFVAALALEPVRDVRLELVRDVRPEPDPGAALDHVKE